MDAENSTSQMRRGLLEFCVVALLAEREIYAAELITRLRAAELIVTDGTLYPLLSRLQKGGLLQYNWVESESGPPRKYYSLTPEGKAYLRALDGAWLAMTKSVEMIRGGRDNE